MADEVRVTTLDVAQADSLYRGFPDFSEWGSLTPDDIDLWERVASSLAERRRAATPEMLERAAEVAVRAAAVDTGAIEGLYSADRGFTMTVAVQGLAWQQMLEERGEGVRELFEAQLAAYELVLDAVTHKLPITEAWIRALHEKLCAPQKTYRVLTDMGWQQQDLPKGRYKTQPNHVLLSDGTFHAYAPVDQVSSEMYRLLQQIRTSDFETAHPVLQASYCHYALVVIHPFADGNGRVARALASTFFYRAQSIPLIIFANQRPAYLDALAQADRDEYQPVISFFEDRGIDTMQLVSESLLTGQTPDPKKSASRIRELVASDHELPLREISAIGARLEKEVSDQFEAQFGSLNLPELSLTTGRSLSGRPSPWSIGARRFTFKRQDPPVLVAEVEFSIGYYQDRPSHLPFTILAQGNDDKLELRLEDVYPELTPMFKFRIANWVQRQLSRMLADLAQQTGSR